MFENTQLAIAWVAVICAALSFILHVAFSIGLIITPAQKAEAEVRAAIAAGKARAEAATPKDAAEVLKALAAIIDSLVKAGPSLWSMIGAALFLLVACLASGVMSPPAAAAPDPAAAEISEPSPTKTTTVPAAD